MRNEAQILTRLSSVSEGPLGGLNSGIVEFSPIGVSILLISSGFRMLEMILICPPYFEQEYRKNKGAFLLNGEVFNNSLKSEMKRDAKKG